MYFPELSGLGKTKKPRMEKRTSPTGVNYWVPVADSSPAPVRHKKFKQPKLKGRAKDSTTYSGAYFNKARQLSPARTALINNAELIVQHAASQLGLTQDQYALAVDHFYKKGGDWPFGLDSFNFIRQSLYALGDFYDPVLTNEERSNRSKWLISMKFGIPFDQVGTKGTVSTDYESAGYGQDVAESIAMQQHVDPAIQHQFQVEAQAQQNIAAAQAQNTAQGDLTFATSYAEQSNNLTAAAIGSFVSSVPQFLVVTRDPSTGRVTLTPTTQHPGHYTDLNSMAPEPISSNEAWALEEQRSKLYGKPIQQIMGPANQDRPEPQPEKTVPPEPVLPQNVASQDKPWAAKSFRPVSW